MHKTVMASIAPFVLVLSLLAGVNTPAQAWGGGVIRNSGNHPFMVCINALSETACASGVRWLYPGQSSTMYAADTDMVSGGSTATGRVKCQYHHYAYGWTDFGVYYSGFRKIGMANLRCFVF